MDLIRRTDLSAPECLPTKGYTQHFASVTFIMKSKKIIAFAEYSVNVVLATVSIAARCATLVDVQNVHLLLQRDLRISFGIPLDLSALRQNY